jgi:alpha-1,2-mannosyltransferase
MAQQWRRQGFGCISVLEVLRSGAWLTPSRLKIYPRLLLAAFLLSALAILAGGEGGRDLRGKPLGTDFMFFYAASFETLKGQPERVYDPVRQSEVQSLIPGKAHEAPYYAWHFPPTILLLITPLALLPYLPSLALWLGATLLACWAAGRSIFADSRILLGCAAFPGLFINAMNGQSGFLTAALFGGALTVLDRRPWLAGLLIGLLSCKPQFGLLIPLALIAGGRWRAFWFAACFSLALAALSGMVYGAEVWRAFQNSLATTERLLLSQGAIDFAKELSLFGFVRHWGGGEGLAWAVQGLLALWAAFVVFRLWSSAASFEDKASALILGSLLATPHLVDYDLILLGIVLLFLVRQGIQSGFRPWEVSLLASLWLLPLVARSSGFLGLPLAPLAEGALLWAVWQGWRLPGRPIRV